jgi:PAS domain S-box-containing protein
MTATPAAESSGLSRRLWFFVAVLVAVAIFVITWVSIRKSHADSYSLLVQQGTAFTEALAQASENAITAETFYDRLVQARYSDLARRLAEIDLQELSEADLVEFVRANDLFGAYVYAADSTLVAEGTGVRARTRLPEYVREEVYQLLADPEVNYVLLLDENDAAGEVIHYYLELANRLDRVVVLAADALYYWEAMRQTGIGYLAQNMAREQGVEYIIYQSTEGIIFASKRPGELLAIESDPFLTAALEADTISSRRYEFQGKSVLELVRPFASPQYPFGLFRVGISLDGYDAVTRGFNIQMALLAVVLFCLLMVAILYINSRAKRAEIGRRYLRMKSVTDRIFEQMRTGVAVVDGGGIIRMANQAFESIFGVDQTQGRELAGVIAPELLSPENLVTEGRSSGETEVSLPRQDGNRQLLVAVSDLPHGDTGTPDKLLVVYDITRLRQFERAAARRERLSEMGHLAAGVAHEIRNPLNTIAIAAQRLEAEFAPGENRETFASFTRKIRSETSRLNEIITRFLALTRAQTGKRDRVSIDRLVKDFAALVQTEAQELGLKLQVSVDSAAELAADADEIKQLLLNLFNNAKEALAGREGRIEIRSSRREGALVIEFDDDGPGIDENLKDEVFAPYFTTKEAGTGLGLPTVHKIVTDLGGEIRIVESRLGGTSFVITIPLIDGK